MSETGPAAVDDRRRLHPAVVTLWRLRAFVFVLIVGVVTLPMAVGVLFTRPYGWPLILLAWLAFMILLVVRALWWPAVRYRHAWWRLAPDGLTIWRGVIVRAVTSVPISRVQHTDVSQGPFERRFGLATLIVHTAGTQFAAVPLGGLSHEDALAARDILIEGGDDDAV